jgi:hypothetical protein
MTIRSAIAIVCQQEDLNFLLTNRIPRRLVTRFMGWFSQIEQPLVRELSIATWRLFSDLDLSEARKRRVVDFCGCRWHGSEVGRRVGAADVVKNGCHPREALPAGLQLGQMLSRAHQAIPILVDVLRRTANLGHHLRHFENLANMSKQGLFVYKGRDSNAVPSFAAYAPLNPLCELVRYLVVGFVPPPHQDVGRIKHVVGQTVLWFVKCRGANMGGFAKRASEGRRDRAVDAVRVHGCRYPVEAFVDIFVPDDDVHGWPRRWLSAGACCATSPAPTKAASGPKNARWIGSDRVCSVQMCARVAEITVSQ